MGATDFISMWFLNDGDYEDIENDGLTSIEWNINERNPSEHITIRQPSR